mmetsp:Transcript_9905/g.14701  ORF Transcript_9905/g.14701 Transcript_9905/m.14701 type:complete len:891 (+) Transcript_9905:39-2711(+)
MSSYRTRTSLGGGALLGDASSRRESRSSSVPRRMSFGGAPPDSDGSDKKDRRAMLEEWRMQVRNRNNPPTLSSSKEEHGDRKRRLHDNEGQTMPPLPPSSSSADGMTALERFRMRKQQRLQSENDENAEPNIPLPPQSTSKASSSRSNYCSDDETSSRTGTTPSFNRRLSISGGARKARRKSVAGAKRRNRDSLTPNEPNVTPGKSPEPMEESNAVSGITSSASEDLNSIKEAGLRSRVQEMQQRITQLEKEKMALSMSKAPLEARFRQKEDSWLKEQKKLMHEINSQKNSVNESNGQIRQLELQMSALEEENTQLREDARKVAFTLKTEESGSNTWNRQLQNDRDVAELKDKLRYAEDEIKALRLEKFSVETEVRGTKMEFDSLLKSFDELQADYEELLKSKSQNSEAEIKLKVLTTEHIATAAQLNAVSSDLAATKSTLQAKLNAKEEDLNKIIDQLKFDNAVLKTRAATCTDDAKQSPLADGVEDEAVLKARVEQRDSRIAELEARVLNLEQIRRKMHNRIQELRGNIRVYVRTRPFLPSDGQSTDCCVDVLPDGESLSVIDQRNNTPLDFKFDKVFPPSAGQDCVFEEVSEFVQSALDGYNVCLFSYGQTGSGKTHTMQGSGNNAMRGIIPRAVEQILNQAHLMQRQKWQFTIKASFLEIYNEELKDLLVHMDSTGTSTRSTVAKKNNKLAIKRDANGKSYVDGLTQMKIDTESADVGMEQLDAVVAAAARARSVASTKMNAQSSRSHSVFILHLRGFNEDSGTIVQGALNLCDLAGSERLDRSGAGSDSRRLRETKAINKSLSCLGDVFNSLANGSAHIPFRNSKLTYLLQDCLSGDGKALMFVNLSPTLESSHESLCSLRFAQRVNQVELGKASKNVEYSKNGR